MSSANNWDQIGETTIYANWVAMAFTVMLDPQNGNNSIPITVVYNEEMPLKTEITQSKTGHIFQGYYEKVGGQGVKYYHNDMTSANIWNQAANTTIYAYWVKAQYVVTLDKQGGSGGPEHVEVEFGSSMPSANPPSRYGYEFCGYFSEIQIYPENPGNGKQYYNSNMVSVNNWDQEGIVTIYAHWIGIQSVITFSLQGGTLEGDDSTVVRYDSAMPTSGLSAPTKTGYTFKGYYEFTEGNGVKYYDGPNLSSVAI